MENGAPSFGPSVENGSGTLDFCHWWNFAVAACLAGGAGIRATLPAFLISVLHQLSPEDYPLSPQADWIGKPEICFLLGLLLLLEILADMIPAVDHAVHAILTPAHPAMGAFMAVTPDYCGGAITKVPMACAGAFMALGVHSGKAAVRAGSSATTGGMANPCVSVVESVVALFVMVSSVIHPYIALAAVALFGCIAIKGLQTVREFAGDSQDARNLAEEPPNAYGPGPGWAPNGQWNYKQAQPATANYAAGRGTGTAAWVGPPAYASGAATVSPNPNQAFFGMRDEDYQRLLHETELQSLLNSEDGEGSGGAGNELTWPLSSQQHASALRAEASHEVERILAAASPSAVLGCGSACDQKSEFRRLVRLLHPDKGNVRGERAALALRRVVEANRSLEGLP